MLYHLEGSIAEYGPDYLVLDCSGIGFYLSITPGTASGLKLGEKKKIYVSEAIGESNFDLYGFSSSVEKKCFEMLTTVSGIGPKAALSILSYNTPASVSSAIVSGNESAFTQCPGIGKKIAQRIILELKDKIAKASDYGSYPLPTGQNPGSAPGSKAYNDALSALSVLGYSQGETIPVLKQIDTSGMSSDEIIRAVLKFMI